MSTEWSKPTKYIVAVGLVLFGLTLLYISRSVLAVVIISALIAFLLNPIIVFLQKRFRFRRGLAVLTAYVLAVIVVLLAPLIFVPPIIDGFNYLSNIDYQILVENSVQWVQNSLHTLKEVDIRFLGFATNLDPIIDPAIELIENADTEVPITLPSIETLSRSLWSGISVTYGFATNLAGSVFTGLFTFIILILSAIYMSLGANTYHKNLMKLVPPIFHDEVNALLKRLRFIWQAYLRGQLKLMLIIGTVTWLGNAALGLPGAFVLGVIAGLLELIPNLGPILAAIPAVVVALLQGSTYLDVNNLVFALIIIGFYTLVQQFENTVVVPRVLGDAVELPPLVVILGVWIGASVWGILGALLAAPVIASGREIIWYLYKKILGENPFPAGQVKPEKERPPVTDQLRILAKKVRDIVRRPPAPAETQETPPQTVSDN